MNVAIVITRIGAAVATILPSGVSPMKRVATAETPAATAPATRKMSTAAMTFGRYAYTAATKSVSAFTPSTDTASDSAPRNTAQNVNEPTRRDGLAVALRTHVPALPRDNVWSRP